MGSNEGGPIPPFSVGMRRRLAAILHADVQGYSRLMGEDEVATLHTLTPYLEMMSALVRQHGGRVAGSAGDSLLAEFPSVVEAVQCAIETQQELKRRNAELPTSRQVKFRMGLNLGEIVVEGEQIHGDGINIAVRLEGLADAGGICLSEVVYKQIKNKLAVEYEDLGEHVLKNIVEPVRVYRVRMEHEVPTPGASRETGASLKPPALALPEQPSIAVLPFVNMSEDPEQEYFSDGMTEELITVLSRFPGVFVIARNSVFLYKGQAVDVRQVGRELGVRYVVEGSVRKSGERVRITAQLVEATTGYHLWAERYDQELRDIFALQDEITQQLVASLGAEVWQAEKERVRRLPTENLAAYDYFLRGAEAYFRLTKEAMAQARQQFERAIERDPKYAVAYVWVGWTYVMEWSWQWSQDPQILARCLDLAHTALALDDSLPEAHRLLSEVWLWHGQHEQAIAEGEHALALNPNDAYSYSMLATALTFAGQPQAAREMAEKAMRLDPRNQEWYLLDVGLAAAVSGQYEEAIAALRRAALRYPMHVGAHMLLAGLYAGQGREEAARAEAAEVLRLNPDFSVEGVRQRSGGMSPAVLEPFLAALRKAGLK